MKKIILSLSILFISIGVNAQWKTFNQFGVQIPVSTSDSVRLIPSVSATGYAIIPTTKMLRDAIFNASGNYIKNGTTPQPASFNINGTATFDNSNGTTSIDGGNVFVGSQLSVPLTLASDSSDRAASTKWTKQLIKGKANLIGNNSFTGNQNILGKVAITSPTPIGSANAISPLTVQGANGGNNPATTGLAQAGNVDEITILAGNGGSSVGNTSGTAIGGRGGSITLRSGSGGLATGATAFGGNAGNATLQAGTSLAQGGVAGYAELKAGNSDYLGGIGGNFSSVDNQTYNGAVYLGVSNIGTVRGNTIVGANTDDRTNRLQVTGSSKFNGDLEVSNASQLRLSPSTGTYPYTSIRNDGVVSYTSATERTQFGYNKLGYYNNGFNSQLIQNALTASRTISLPDATGTVALTNQIPDISGKLDKSGGAMTGMLYTQGLSTSGTTTIQGGFDGTPAVNFTVPTYVASTNNNSVASTAHVKSVVATGQSIGANTTGNAATASISNNSTLWNGYQHDMNSVVNSNPGLLDYILTVQSDKVSKTTLPTIKSALATSLQDVTSFGNTTTTGATFGGNVGIGTTTPSEKLDVNGNIKSSSLVNPTTQGVLTSDGNGKIYNNTAPIISALGLRSATYIATLSSNTLTANRSISFPDDVGTLSLGTKIIRTASGDGSSTTILVPHGLPGITSANYVSVTANNAASAGIQYATLNGTDVQIVYTVAPASGTNNLRYSIEIK